jgi:hypothetical protein
MYKESNDNDQLASSCREANVPDAIQREVVTLKKFFLKKFGVLPSICRIDFLKTDTGYEILEVELIDPDLFFRFIPENMRNKAISVLYKSLTI